MTLGQHFRRIPVKMDLQLLIFISMGWKADNEINRCGVSWPKKRLYLIQLGLGGSKILVGA